MIQVIPDHKLHDLNPFNDPVRDALTCEVWSLLYTELEWTIKRMSVLPGMNVHYATGIIKRELINDPNL